MLMTGWRDRGSTSLTTVLLTPVFVVIAFAAFQAAMWSHARTEARVVARDSAALVARSDVSEAAATESATAILRADTDLRDPVVDVSSNGRFVTVTITGRAPGIFRSTSVPVEIVEAVPVEGFRP
jgi:hypothetical protein